MGRRSSGLHPIRKELKDVLYALRHTPSVQHPIRKELKVCLQYLYLLSYRSLHPIRKELKGREHRHPEVVCLISLHPIRKELKVLIALLTGDKELIQTMGIQLGRN